MDSKWTAEDPKPLPKIHISNFNKNCHLGRVIGQSGHQTTSSILAVEAPAGWPNNAMLAQHFIRVNPNAFNCSRSWMLISDWIPDHSLLSSCISNIYELRNRLPLLLHHTPSKDFIFAHCSQLLLDFSSHPYFHNPLFPYFHIYSPIIKEKPHMLLLANGRSSLKQRSVFRIFTFVRLSARLEAAVLSVDLGKRWF